MPQDLRYRCPNCGRIVEVADHMVGTVIECPNPDCDNPFKVEAPVSRPLGPDEVGADEPLTMMSHSKEEEETLRVVHPAMFRNSPLKYIGLAALVIVGGVGAIASLVTGDSIVNEDWISDTIQLGVCLVVALAALLAFGVWWLKVMNTTLTVTDKRTIFRKGIISKETSEVQHDDVRNMQVDQNMVQRIMGVGDIAISSSGQSGLEIVVRAIPNPEGVTNLVRDLQ